MKENYRMIKTITSLSVIAGLLVVLISPVAFASETPAEGIWTSSSAFNSNSSIEIAYNTPDISNCLHTGVIEKGDIVDSYPTGTNNSGSFKWGKGKAEGTYAIKLLVNGSVNSSCTVKVDNTMPTSTYAFSKSKQSDGSYRAGVKLSFSATDAGGSGVSGIYYWYSDGNHKVYRSPIEFNTPGEYTITFKATDNAGNLETVDGTYRTVSFKVTEGAITSATPAGSPTIKPTVPPADEPSTGMSGEVLLTDKVTITPQQTQALAQTSDGLAGTLTSTTSLILIGAASMIILVGAAFFFWKN